MEKSQPIFLHKQNIPPPQKSPNKTENKSKLENISDLRSSQTFHVGRVDDMV